MAQLRRDYKKFEKRGVIILVVGPEDAASFSKYFQENTLPFRGLPDPTHSVLKLYGQEIKLFKFGRMPAQLLIDGKGTVRFVHYGHDMTDIPKPVEILEMIDNLNAEEKKD